ncbi:DEAD-box ATP-dependent RNA helicase CshA [Clostridium pasteurianum DSM 525 = ATCC 6013]|uniref:ATP-dependent RNA helicase CshA n=1 Tax=Clostridium pasteurianum DSM 525 = ATCC 6013 TaxID=1262449 RepID=A0A0H3J1F6_CLOPA|nr:DEAD/DEAH box helicase [Clostridium pasteurianum]AJA47711.1 DEAD-box ATP-dependent RNA helicase CshA [Clostridium pasteurianum DSM 525 = ATCC 6013]AJA51699.1 DEAD-box ATP-dependent RNA helicase CshA [Clostridium pasteurianum DSM 525 = ATCC 6013]AOZ75011.1 DEAD/DEAH box helicase [Clostridium pasteurianum DSM 525 = ATCC 6013]AOZ78806.1 DEAD/DEAH box helicase [Clostridium pasteurianum]ELP59613.1 ATP-dependent RNA helicase (superfamily II) [Clostridium pasteurianum DSM 525 = ATCC 6013]
MKNIKFTELELKDTVLKAIDDMGFENPSEIQSASIPVIMEGFDIIGQAQTGTGKTCAFGAPIISKIDTSKRFIQALILTPTRELAIQIYEELRRLSKYDKVRSLPVYGGQSMDRQISSIKKDVSIIVGTPGRVLDHIRRKTLKLNNLNYLVLDEADEMLNMGFIDDIEEIIKNTNSERQTLLFSATMPKPIKKLSENYLKKDVKHIQILKKSLTVSKIDQYYYEVHNNTRLESLCRILDISEPESAIIFCRTKKSVDELVSTMSSKGYNIEGMHGDMKQKNRLSTLNKFKNGNLTFLAATDVAARGIDVENITHVINYELPQDTESYVHRIGRTGRANRSGTAISLITRKDFTKLKQIEKDIKSKITKQKIPTMQEIINIKSKNIVSKVSNILSTEEYKKFEPIIENLGKEYSLNQIAAALLKNALDKEISTEYNDDLFNQENSVRLFMSIGRRDGINIKSLLEFIDTTSTVNSNYIGSIDILDKFSFVDVNEKKVSLVIKNTDGKKFNNRRVNIEVAKNKN